MKRTIQILVFTLVIGAIAEYTMKDIRQIIEDHQQQVIRAGRTRTGRKEYADFKL
jgi:hypothetical protein